MAIKDNGEIIFFSNRGCSLLRMSFSRASEPLCWGTLNNQKILKLLELTGHIKSSERYPALVNVVPIKILKVLRLVFILSVNSFWQEIWHRRFQINCVTSEARRSDFLRFQDLRFELSAFSISASSEDCRRISELSSNKFLKVWWPDWVRRHGIYLRLCF